MKEIKNWEALELRDGNEVTAIPLPGCIIKGELDGKEIRVNAFDINIRSLTVTTTENEKYRLFGARPDYLETLNKFIELGKDKNIQPQDIKIENLGTKDDKGFER